MNISIKTIPNDSHRKGFSGADWYYDQDGALQVRVSSLSDWRWEVCLALHELVEALLCEHHGVTQQSVDEYDTAYEKTHSVKCNAGDESDAPYKREHCFATAVERILAAEMGVNWLEYDKELESL